MAKQQSLAGIGPKEIPEISDAAEELRKLRTQRQTLAKEEEEAQIALRDLLKKHGIRGKYVYEGEDGEGNTVKFDAMIEKAEERAFVRKHKDPKAKEKDNGKEEEPGASDE